MQTHIFIKINSLFIYGRTGGRRCFFLKKRQTFFEKVCFGVRKPCLRLNRVAAGVFFCWTTYLFEKGLFRLIIGKDLLMNVNICLIGYSLSSMHHAWCKVRAGVACNLLAIRGDIGLCLCIHGMYNMNVKQIRQYNVYLTICLNIYIYIQGERERERVSQRGIYA